MFGLYEGAGDQQYTANHRPGGATLTVEIDSILVNEELAVLLEAAEANGQVRQVDLNEILEPLELEPLELEAVNQELDRRGIAPPIDVLPSLSRLMNAGIGDGSTREDHRGVADQISAFLGRGRELRNLISIVGKQALSDDDRRILAFVDQFERRFVGQGAERRSIIETLDLAWELLAAFPADDLKRITPELVERYHRNVAELA